MNNSARKYNYRNEEYDDYEDIDLYDAPPPRQNTNRVPNGNMRSSLPQYNIRQVGQGDAQITRRANVPPEPIGYIAQPRQPTGNYPVARTAQVRPPVPTFKNSAKARPSAQVGGFLANLPIPSGSMMRLGMWLVGALVLALLSFFILSNVFSWWQTWQDDMTYGRPRTMQVDSYVGHNEAAGKPSHFIAQNIEGQVNIIQYPGNDTSKTRVIQGPRLFGKNAALAPVKIEFKDVNADGHVDLIARVDGQVLVYINENGNFRPIRSEEESRVKQTVGDK